MPDKVKVQCMGLVQKITKEKVILIDGAAVKIPEGLLYEHAEDYSWVVIPRWLAEEKDIEHCIEAVVP